MTLLVALGLADVVAFVMDTGAIGGLVFLLALGALRLVTRWSRRAPTNLEASGPPATSQK